MSVGDKELAKLNSFDAICGFTNKYAAIDDYKDNNSNSNSLTCIAKTIKTINNSYNNHLIDSPINYDYLTYESFKVIIQQIKCYFLEEVINMPTVIIDIIIDYITIIPSQFYLLLSTQDVFFANFAVKRKYITIKLPNNNNAIINNNNTNNTNSNNKEVNISPILTTEFIQEVYWESSGIQNYKPTLSNYPVSEFTAYNLSFHYCNLKLFDTITLLAPHYKNDNINFYRGAYTQFDLNYALFTGYTIEIYNINDININNNECYSKLTLITPYINCYKTHSYDKIQLILNDNYNANQLLVIYNELLLLYNLNNGQLINYSILLSFHTKVGTYLLSPNNQLMYITNREKNWINTLNIETNLYDTQSIQLPCKGHVQLSRLNNHYYSISENSNKNIYIYSFNDHQLICEFNSPTQNPQYYLTNYKSYIHNYFAIKNQNKQNNEAITFPIVIDTPLYKFIQYKSYVNDINVIV